MIRFILISILSFFLSLTVFAAEYELFNSNGDQVENYDQIIKNLKPGDVLILSKGRIVIRKYLGEGNTTKIFSIGEGKVIRLPLSNKLFKGHWRYTVYIQQYFLGYQELKNSKIPIPRLYEDESDSNKYLVVEEIVPYFGLNQFLNKPTIEMKKNWESYYKKLVEFVKSTYEYEKIDDVHIGQIVWTNKGWMLLDYMSGTEKEVFASTIMRRTIFSGMNYLPEKHKRHFEQHIFKLRDKKFKSIYKLFSEHKYSDIFQLYETSESEEVKNLIYQELVKTKPNLELRMIVRGQVDRPIEELLNNKDKISFYAWKELFAHSDWAKTEEADLFFKRLVNYENHHFGSNWTVEFLTKSSWEQKENILELFDLAIKNMNYSAVASAYHYKFSNSSFWIKHLQKICPKCNREDDWKSLSAKLKNGIKKKSSQVSCKVIFN